MAAEGTNIAQSSAASFQEFKKLSPEMQSAIEARKNWMLTARPKQLAPVNCSCHDEGKWIVWLLMGGRGAGKTRTGAEDVGWYGCVTPAARIAVIAPTIGDARDTCFEGHSGLINVLPKKCIKTWNRSLGELVLFNDTRFKAFSAEEPERLRGPQHHRAWCDELGAWRYGQETWDNMMFGLRLGEDPRVIVTTTPRPTQLVRTIVKDGRTHVTRESTYANETNLPATVMKAFRDRYANTRLGRQELDAELLDDVPGSLWRRALIDDTRIKASELPELKRVVVAIDPAVGEPDSDEGLAETGIIVAALGVDGRGYLLEDLSGRFLPDEWARRAISGIDMFDGDAIVAEINQGGVMVKNTIKSARNTVKVIEVRASKGKVTRAEPISALYEQRRISHVGTHPQLEDQMVAFTSAGILGGTTGDRVDAMVWALTELFPQLTKKKPIGPLRVETVSGYRPHGF